MTPGARVQAAIEVLDRVLRGAPAERELTAWSRASRYAGSKDRAAVRDHVFDVLRNLRSAAWAGGQGDVPLASMDARAVMAGLLRLQGVDPASLFTGEGHAPDPIHLSDDPGPMPDGVRADLPDWLLGPMRDGLGSKSADVFEALRTRAPVFLRTNLARITRAELVERLRAGGFDAAAEPFATGAIRIEGQARGLSNLDAFADGLFEFQDAGSQSLVDRLPLTPGARILDLCAGGGGKTLAMAARGAGPLFAHDADPARLRDLPLRGARAGASVTLLSRPEDSAPFEGVVADVPCSGSGSWRRAPEARWRLTPQRLAELNRLQDEILDRAIALTRPGGWIAYMTCSVLDAENTQRIRAAVDRDGRLEPLSQWSCLPVEGGPDGFYLALLRRLG